jgi:hypothetical protein
MLTSALDELRQGRVLEVADILASRYRALTTYAESGEWEIAREYLTYMEQGHGLVSDAMEDAAVRLVTQRRRRERKHKLSTR